MVPIRRRTERSPGRSLEPHHSSSVRSQLREQEEEALMARSVPVNSVPVSDLMTSLTVICGVVAGPPVHRFSDSANSFELDVKSRSSSGQVASVSVVMTGELPAVVEGDVLLVVGTARRRFFRTSGATVSRTEVEASVLVVNPDKRKRRRVLDDAMALLARMADAPNS